MSRSKPYVCTMVAKCPSKVKVKSCGIGATLKIQVDMLHAHKSRKEEFSGGLEPHS